MRYGTIDVNTGLNESGDLSVNFLTKNLTKIGDTITVKNQTIPLQGSEKREVMGKNMDRWVAEATVD